MSFSGRFKHKEKNNNKPDKYGIVIRAICDSKNGFLFAFDIADLDVKNVDSNDKITEKMVLNLNKNLPARGYTLVADNYFSFLTLVKKLHDLGFNYYGTVRKN